MTLVLPFGPVRPVSCYHSFGPSFLCVVPTCFTGARSVDGDDTHSGSRGSGVLRHELTHSQRGAASEDDDNEDPKPDPDSARRGSMASVSERPKGHVANGREVDYGDHTKHPA